MKNKTRLIKLIKSFYTDDQGVYAVMTGLLSFVLIGMAALAVDGSGLLLDKARLAQGTEQAALVLVAESNAFREEKEHADVLRQTVTQADKDRFDGDEFKAKQDKRNQELIQGVVKTYLRTAHNNQDNSMDSAAAVTVNGNGFDYNCEEIEIATSANSVKKPTICSVTAEVNRKSWLYLNNSSLSFDKREKINSGLTYAVKQKNVTIPIDVILVNDFSSSMTGQETDGRRIDILRSVVGEVADILLPETLTEDVSPYNRMGFVTFAGGVPQRNMMNQCIFPFYGKSDYIEWWLTGNAYNYYSDFVNMFKNSSATIKLYANERKFSIKVKANEFMQIMSNNINRVNQYYWYVNDQFYRYVDYAKTVKEIDNFDGKNRDYDITFTNSPQCLGGNSVYGRSNSVLQPTQAWFTQQKRNFLSEFQKINPAGNTSAISGLLVGANIMMDKNSDPEAQPSKLTTNTQRIILVFSDGEDNVPTNALVNTINAGACEAIRKKVDSLQDDDYKKLPTKLGFVVFGSTPTANQAIAWKKCVGEDNYYLARNKAELLEAFKQIISIDEEVGKLSNEKPSF